MRPGEFTINADRDINPPSSNRAAVKRALWRFDVPATVDGLSAATGLHKSEVRAELAAITRNGEARRQGGGWVAIPSVQRGAKRRMR